MNEGEVNKTSRRPTRYASSRLLWENAPVAGEGNNEPLYPTVDPGCSAVGVFTVLKAPRGFRAAPGQYHPPIDNRATADPERCDILYVPAGSCRGLLN